MPANRMNREEFFAKLAPMDEAHLRKVLWNLNWRGSAQVRERIEAELSPAEQQARKQKAAGPPDPRLVLGDVTEFVGLARDGAYMAGDRRVSRSERSKWRVTFRDLATQAQFALHAADTGPAEKAMELIIDLANDIRDYEYFHSDDPVEAARFVVSDAVSALWQTVLAQHGFEEFARRAARQLIRWESRYGRTRFGDGKVREREVSLAKVLKTMLTTPDEWIAFGDAYLDALNPHAPLPAKSRSWNASYSIKRRTDDLAEWHGMLLDRLRGAGAGDRPDRLVNHGALGGPQLTFLRARLAQIRGDRDAAHGLTTECLEELPGSVEFLDFAAEVGAELPRRAREIADERIRFGF
jgi:hypothetical protein